MTNNIRFEDWRREQMKDPGFRAAVQALEPAYQVARLRIKKGLTQKELAKLVGTRQSSISRLESGKSQPSLTFLRRVVEALGGKMVVQITEAPAPIPCDQPDISTDSGVDAAYIILNWPQRSPSSPLILTANSSSTSQ